MSCISFYEDCVSYLGSCNSALEWLAIITVYSWKKWNVFRLKDTVHRKNVQDFGTYLQERKETAQQSQFQVKV